MSSKKAVYAALLGNLCIALFKLAAALMGKSSSLLAEAYHSFSDTINQVLLLIGISRSAKAPDKRHPYGYGKVQFFYAFVVAMLIFGVAGVLSLREGFHRLLHPAPLENIAILYLSLGVALVFETFALRIAYKELKEEMHEESFTSIVQAIKESKDPTILTVVFEDSLALLSIFIAGISISLSYLLQKPFFDALGSVLIGALLMIFAFLLARETKKLLIGEAVSESKKKKIEEAILKTEGVNEVLDLHTMHLGPEEVVINTEVNFNENLTTKQVEKVIDKVEQNLKKIFPKSICYIEAGGKVECVIVSEEGKENKENEGHGSRNRNGSSEQK